MKEFTRENRYIVFKRSEVEKALNSDELQMLATLADKIAKYRTEIRHKQPLECAVVENDWPEYEVVWDMVENRVKNDGT